MQGHTTDQLHIEMPQAERPVSRFTHYRKDLRKNIVQCIPVGQALFELRCFSGQLLIVQRLYVIRKGIDLFNDLAHAL